MQDRVCYYSKNDLSIGYYLDMAEKRIQKVSEGDVPTDLEGIIELWHIKRMIDDDCRLLKWTDADFNTLKDNTSGYNNTIARFFNSLNPKTLKDDFDRLEWTYKKTFWKIIEAYKLYKLIEPDILRTILNENINYVFVVLECQRIVDKNKDLIREILLSKADSALILIDKYVARQDTNNHSELFLPSNLTLDDKEQILLNYLQSDDPNINYVRLITQIKDDNKQIRLSPKTRLIAERLAKKLNDDLMSDPRTVTTHRSLGIQFLNEEGLPPVQLKIDINGVPNYTYSIPYIRNCGNIKRIANCISLFGWLNNHFLINLINKMSEVDTMETLFIDRGRNSYPSYIEFNHKNDISLCQLLGYDEVLKKNNSSFENELKQFYEHHLKETYNYHGLSINFPSSNDSALNKCRILCPELDSVVKQFNTYVEEDVIDKDLIRLSKPIKVEEGKSLLANKYYEIAKDNNDIWIILKGLFDSGNSLLHYVKPYKDNYYHSLIELLEKEKNVRYSDYEDYQKPHLDFLIQHSIINVNQEGYLYIVNPSTIKILRSLWEFGVCSYWHYSKEEQEVIDEMFNKGWLEKDDHLLSKPERDYFSYYLDNMAFTNGMAYRNHYMHGSTPPVDDEKTHNKAYLTFLKLLTLLILKIEDDLWLADRAVAIYAISEIKKRSLKK